MSDLSKFSNNELVKLYCETENILYFNALFHKNTDIVYWQALQMFKGYPLAEVYASEVHSNVFVKVFFNMCNGKINNFNSWLAVILKNTALDLIAKLKREQVFKTTYATSLNNLDSIPDLNFTQCEDLFNGNYTIDMVLAYLKIDLDVLFKDAIAQLSSEDIRICATLFYIKHLPYKSIVIETGFSRRKVVSLLQNSRRNLTKLLRTKIIETCRQTH